MKVTLPDGTVVEGTPVEVDDFMRRNAKSVPIEVPEDPHFPYPRPCPHPTYPRPWRRLPPYTLGDRHWVGKRNPNIKITLGCGTSIEGNDGFIKC